MPFEDKVINLNETSEIIVHKLADLRENVTCSSSCPKHLKFRFNNRMNRACSMALKLFTARRTLKKLTAGKGPTRKKTTLAVRANKMRLLERRTNVRIMKNLNGPLLKDNEGGHYRPGSIDEPDEFFYTYYNVNKWADPCDYLTRNCHKPVNELSQITHLNDAEILSAFGDVFPHTRHYSRSRIDYMVFRESYPYLKNVINEVCKLSLSLSLWCAVVPKICQSVVGHLIQKQSGNGFRLVHMSKPLLALLEKIVERRFKHLLIEHDSFNVNVYNQPLYRSDDVFTCIYNEYMKYRDLRKGQSLNGLSIFFYKLDIKSAFDRVDHYHLL